MELKTQWTTDHNNPETDGQHTASSELIDGEPIGAFVERHLELISALNHGIALLNPGPLPGDPPVVAAGPGIDLQAAEKISSLKRERDEREAAEKTASLKRERGERQRGFMDTADDPPVKVEAQPVPGEPKPVGLRSRRRRRATPESETADDPQQIRSGLVANPRRRETSEPEVSE